MQTHLFGTNISPCCLSSASRPRPHAAGRNLAPTLGRIQWCPRRPQLNCTWSPLRRVCAPPSARAVRPPAAGEPFPPGKRALPTWSRPRPRARFHTTGAPCTLPVRRSARAARPSAVSAPAQVREPWAAAVNRHAARCGTDSSRLVARCKLGRSLRSSTKRPGTACPTLASSRHAYGVRLMLIVRPHATRTVTRHASRAGLRLLVGR